MVNFFAFLAIEYVVAFALYANMHDFSSEAWEAWVGERNTLVSVTDSRLESVIAKRGRALFDSVWFGPVM